MAFTLAHPAAAVPLLRPLGRYGVLSALVIGSMVPDFWYFVPLANRNGSHSVLGLFTYCLPVGLLAYWVFHAGLKRPLIDLFPPRVAERLHARAGPDLFPRASPFAVGVSMLVGAMTHNVWDAFTHSRGRLADSVDWLHFVVFYRNGFELRVDQVLQVFTSAAGLALFIAWIVVWLREAPLARRPDVPTARKRSMLLALLLLVLAAFSGAVAYVEVVGGLHFRATALLGALVRSLLGVAMIAAMLYSAAWHLRHARSAP